MSEQRFTSGGRKREKYIPLRERVQSNITPLYDRPEAQPYVITIESMLEKSTGTLQDSIRAPRQARETSQQRYCTTQNMVPTLKPQDANPSPRGISAWNTETSKPSVAAGHVQSSWENQPSQTGYPSRGGLVASSWAVQPPQSPNPKPEGMASTTDRAGPQQTSTVVSNQFRSGQQVSYVPAHLRGIDLEETCDASPNVQKPFSPSVVGGSTPNSADVAPAPKIPATQDTDGEEWARKMGLLPKAPSKPATPPTQPNHEAEEWARKMGLLAKAAPKKQAPNLQQTSASKVAQKNQATGPVQKVVEPAKNGAPTRADKVAQNAPFNNARFHLKQDSNEHFQQYVQSSTVTNGKKYTFNGSTPAIQQQNTPIANEKAQLPSDPTSVPQQQNRIPPQQQRSFAQQNQGVRPQPATYTQQSSQTHAENRPPFTKQDPHMMFSPAQMAVSNANAGKVNAHQDIPTNGPWPTLQLTDVKSFNENVARELNATEHVTTHIPPLTQDALVTTTGFMPRDHSLNFEDQVSDDGVVQQNTKEGIRATQGMDPSGQLLDWDKKRWAPPPCDWENDRARFDDSFIPDYIKEWRTDIPCGPSIQVNTTSDEFVFGKCPVSNDVLIDPIEQPESTPDIGNAENEMKRTHQTALVDAHNFRARMERKQRRADNFKCASDQRHLEIAMAVDEPNPFSPKVEMYVRPAQQKDAQDIMKIYNYYVLNSIIPEDQQPINLEDAQALIDTAKREKLPFVVAVMGRVPPKHDAQGRTRSAKVILPQVESVIGFAFAERFNYAFSGSTRGRSRGTVTIQLYVDPNNTRRGVGRNTLDQLLRCMATAYAFKNGCPWINPDNDPVHEPNGCGLVHQMIMMVPVLKKDDPNFPWLSKFLYNKFWFKEENRMKSVARSSVAHGAGRMLDMAVLQSELLHEGEFDAFS